MSDNPRPSFGDRPLPRAWTDAAYEPPKAHLSDPTHHHDDSLVSPPNSCSIGSATSWWSEGWAIFRTGMGTWIGITVTLILINFILGLIPIVGGLVTNLLMPVFSGGLMLACYSCENEGELSFGYLFAGFQKNTGQLFMIGLFYLLGIIAIVVVALVIGLVLGLGGGFISGLAGGSGIHSGAASTGILLAALGGVLLGIPLAMSIWFAPALVIIHDLKAFAAMKLSFQGCLRNILPFLVWGLLFIVLAIVATIPIGLGWLLLVPTLTGSTYAAYRAIFTNGA